MTFTIGLVVGLGIGGYLSYLLTKNGYEAKLKSITTVVDTMGRHALADVRSFAARLKAAL